MIAARKTKMVENLFPQLWWGLEIFPQIKEKLASFWEGLSTKEIFMELLFAIKFPWITFFRNRIGRSFIFFPNIYLVCINQGYWRRWIHLDILHIYRYWLYLRVTPATSEIWQLHEGFSGSAWPSITLGYISTTVNKISKFFPKVGHWIGGNFALAHLQGLLPCSILLY